MGEIMAIVMRSLLILCVCLALDADGHFEKALEHKGAQKEGEEEMARIDLDKDGKATMDEVKVYMEKAHYGKEDLKHHEDDEGKPLDPAKIPALVAKDAS